MADIKSTYLKDNLYERIHRELSSNVKSNSLQTYISKYIDYNNKVLLDKGPGKRLHFNDSNIEFIFNSTNISRREVKDLMTKNGLLKDNWKTFNNKEHLWIMTLMARHYMIEKKEKEMWSVLMYLLLSLYSSIQFKYFKYEANENIMNYTINNLSNKYKLKQEGTLFKALFSTLQKCHETRNEDLIEASDASLFTYIMRIRSSVNDLIKNIAIEYYKNKDNGKYLNTEEDSSDEETYYEVDNLSFQIERISNKAVAKILNNPIDTSILNLAVRMSNDVSFGPIKTAVYNIVGKKGNEIKKFITLILQMYLVNEKKSIESISSKQFIITCLKAYTKSNTVDPVIIEMKEILDRWLNDCSDQYIKTNRVATKGQFRKTIFLYFVLMINSAYVS